MLLARVTLTIGEWMDCQRIERPAVLWEDHFKTAAALLHSAQPTAWTSKALHVLATFAERQCEELLGTMDDEAAIAVRMQKHSELRACELAIRESHGSEQARLRGILRRLEAQVAEDEAEVLDMRSQISGFLRIAVWAFARCLESSGSFDSSVYPLVSLLMTHASAPEMAETLAQQTVDRIASAKFLPLAHQLCARLSTDETPFHLVLRRLVYRMAVEYPYHIIGHLFALRNANRTSSAASSKRRERTETDDMEEKRCKAAQGILLQLKSTDAELRSIVDAIDQMCEVYIELAVSAVPEKYRSSKLVNKIIGFGSKMRISRLLHDLPQNIPVFTARPTIGVPGDYTCVPFISSMSEGYSLA
ncbi:Serine/threonine-protein kinase tel1, partial [Linderina pennispora]